MNLHTVKSHLSDLAASTLDHLGDTTRAVGEDVSQGASNVLHSSPISTVGDTVATVGKVIAAAASAKALASAIDPDATTRWVLNALSLQRRPGTLARVATGVGMVAVGVAVGAGVALMLSPKSGPEIRASLLRGLRGLRREAEGAVEEVVTAAREAEHAEEQHEPGVAAGASDASKSTSRAGTSNARPRAPGPSHRSPGS